jgi:serine/threonine-protein phosphatase 6 regulatory subunit 3
MVLKESLIYLLNRRYPYNNFLHHHVENIIVSCLEGKRTELVEHVLNECDIVGKILAADKHSSLSNESNGVSYISML